MIIKDKNGPTLQSGTVFQNGSRVGHHLEHTTRYYPILKSVT